MERLLKCFASFFLDMIFCKYSATKPQPPLGTTSWRQYCDTMNLLTSQVPQGRSADPFLHTKGIFEKFNVVEYFYNFYIVYHLIKNTSGIFFC